MKRIINVRPRLTRSGLVMAMLALLAFAGCSSGGGEGLEAEKGGITKSEVREIRKASKNRSEFTAKLFKKQREVGRAELDARKSGKTNRKPL